MNLSYSPTAPSLHIHNSMPSSMSLLVTISSCYLRWFLKHMHSSYLNFIRYFSLAYLSACSSIPINYILNCVTLLLTFFSFNSYSIYYFHSIIDFYLCEICSSMVVIFCLSSVFWWERDRFYRISLLYCSWLSL